MNTAIGFLDEIAFELKRRGIGLIAPKTKPLAIAESSNTPDFLAELRGGLNEGTDIALFGADWPEVDRVTARTRLLEFARSEQAVRWREDFGPLFFIASGGTTGQRRFAVHTGDTLRAAADGFINGFGASACAAWNVLPLNHVGGFMTLLRALRAGAPWQMGSYRKLAEVAPPKEFRASLSLVPTQLNRLMESPTAVRNLRGFRRIFIGGAGLLDDLADRARSEGLALAPCYGMTETAAMVTALEPDAFERGVVGCGFPLPHARVFLSEENANEASVIGIQSASLALGWDTGEVFDRNVFWTQDTGRFDADGHILITGRLDRIINTGGIKVDPLYVEQVVQQVSGAEDVAVLGLKDNDWGEIVVCFIVGGELTPADLTFVLKQQLLAAEVPKVILPLQILPRSGMGKLNRKALEAIWRGQLKSSIASD